jgi:hypothetical protein
MMTSNLAKPSEFLGDVFMNDQYINTLHQARTLVFRGIDERIETLPPGTYTLAQLCGKENWQQVQFYATHLGRDIAKLARLKLLPLRPTGKTRANHLLYEIVPRGNR